MSSSIEQNELNKFYDSLIQDIRADQLSEEDGGTLEQIFTRKALDLLSDAGETENAREAYDEGQLGTKNQHKINAYAEPDNYETIDLFITIFKGGDEIEKVAKDEIETAAKRISNFFRKGVYKDYVNDIEESAPIFDFAHTLSSSTTLKENLVRVNAIIITNGIYNGDFPETQNISSYPIFYRVVDIAYLNNITQKSHVPITIDFTKDGFEVPCIVSPSVNSEYQSYLAIIPGLALATIYERYGSRLLEQNVRSFLQFTGKINKGIRDTILKRQHMFLAYNNGLAVTANSIGLETSKDGKGQVISVVEDFQIVNGGQTTASIYHTYKKDKIGLSEVFVQLKLSVVKNKDKFSEIVSNISEYANTQNKVSVSDLSSNKPYHIELEKLSRSIYTPHVQGQSTQTKWFYERARGQYKNARIKEGFTKAKQNAFDLKNPKSQVFTKEDLAKYLNAYSEITESKKTIIGPHYVVRGNQKNYVQFVNGSNHTSLKQLDNIYFEDLIAKAILFRTAEKIYGVKPNSIGDMRFITVPYSISLLTYKTDGQLDLYKIWKAQKISENLKILLYKLMVQVEKFIKSSAEKYQGALYGEWAKKEDCWTDLKSVQLDVDFLSISSDFLDPKNPAKRKRITDEETEDAQIQEEYATIKSIPPEIWGTIEEWGKATQLLTPQERNIAFALKGRIRNKSQISNYEREVGMRIIDIVIGSAPEILLGIDDLAQELSQAPIIQEEITMDLIQKMVAWDKKHKRLQNHHFKYMLDLVNGKISLGPQAISYVKVNLERLKKAGFDPI